MLPGDLDLMLPGVMWKFYDTSILAVVGFEGLTNPVPGEAVAGNMMTASLTHCSDGEDEESSHREVPARRGVLCWSGLRQLACCVGCYA